MRIPFIFLWHTQLMCYCLAGSPSLTYFNDGQVNIGKQQSGYREERAKSKVLLSGSFALSNNRPVYINDHKPIKKKRPLPNRPVNDATKYVESPLTEQSKKNNIQKGSDTHKRFGYSYHDVIKEPLYITAPYQPYVSPVTKTVTTEITKTTKTQTILPIKTRYRYHTVTETVQNYHTVTTESITTEEASVPTIYVTTTQQFLHVTQVTVPAKTQIKHIPTTVVVTSTYKYDPPKPSTVYLPSPQIYITTVHDEVLYNPTNKYDYLDKTKYWKPPHQGGYPLQEQPSEYKPEATYTADSIPNYVAQNDVDVLNKYQTLFDALTVNLKPNTDESQPLQTQNNLNQQHPLPQPPHIQTNPNQQHPLPQPLQIQTYPSQQNPLTQPQHIQTNPNQQHTLPQLQYIETNPGQQHKLPQPPHIETNPSQQHTLPQLPYIETNPSQQHTLPKLPYIETNPSQQHTLPQPPHIQNNPSQQYPIPPPQIENNPNQQYPSTTQLLTQNNPNQQYPLPQPPHIQNNGDLQYPLTQASFNENNVNYQLPQSFAGQDNLNEPYLNSFLSSYIDKFNKQYSSESVPLHQDHLYQQYPDSNQQGYPMEESSYPSIENQDTKYEEPSHHQYDQDSYYGPNEYESAVPEVNNAPNPSVVIQVVPPQYSIPERPHIAQSMYEETDAPEVKPSTAVQHIPATSETIYELYEQEAPTSATTYSLFPHINYDIVQQKKLIHKMIQAYDVASKNRPTIDGVVLFQNRHLLQNLAPVQLQQIILDMQRLQEPVLSQYVRVLLKRIINLFPRQSSKEKDEEKETP